MGEEEDRGYVEGEDFVEAAGGEGFEGGAPCCTGVRNEDVDRGDAGGTDGGGEAGYFGGLGEVGGD